MGGARPPGGSSIEFSITPQGFRELALATAAFDKNLAAALRRNIRAAATQVLEDIRREVLSGSYAMDAGMRAGIAAGLKVQVSTSQSRPGVRIVASKGRMPEGKGPMVRAWNKSSFRHQVFGNTEVWMAQQGHPYFDQPIAAARPRFTDAGELAMRQAAAQLAGGA